LHPIVGVGAAVIDRDRIVLVKRAGPPLQGEWSLPGGKVELGETLQEAVAREVLEETGLVVVVGDLITALDRIERSSSGVVEYHYVIVDFVCRVTGGELRRGSDAADVVWVALDEIGQYGLTPAAGSVVAAAFACVKE
jgi:mutator protein MutT